ncbi:MAG: biopolymer transporter ExbD [Pseudomonadota bacterium]
MTSSTINLSGLKSSAREKPEPTIALINVVFLMLIFFLIAGALAPPLDQDLTLVRAADLEGREPPDSLVIKSDGSLSYRQTETTLDAFLGSVQLERGDKQLALRIVPDRELPAQELLDVARQLREQGVDQIFLVTERSLQ